MLSNQNTIHPLEVVDRVCQRDTTPSGWKFQLNNLATKGVNGFKFVKTQFARLLIFQINNKPNWEFNFVELTDIQLTLAMTKFRNHVLYRS